MDPIATAHYGMMAATHRYGDEPAAEVGSSPYLPREAAGGGPVAEERLVEGAGHRRGRATGK